MGQALVQLAALAGKSEGIKARVGPWQVIAFIFNAHAGTQQLGPCRFQRPLKEWRGPSMLPTPIGNVNQPLVPADRCKESTVGEMVTDQAAKPFRRDGRRLVKLQTGICQPLLSILRVGVSSCTIISVHA